MTYTPDSAAFTPEDQPSELYRQWREVSDRIDAEDAARARAQAQAVPAAYVPHAPATDAVGRRLRHDGWTPDRQRAFLAAVAAGETVDRACRLVGLSAASAYAFRQRAVGATFALGWQAANLIARDSVADRLLARAIDGQVETVTRPDGTVISRHKYDNRAALTLLARLDRLAEQAPADPAAAAQSAAARLVAQDFEPFLDLIERDDGPARAGLFLARRQGLAGAQPALEPVLALARADAFVRTGAALPDEVDTADLDPARRSEWTAEQWLRAEAAGLLRVAPAAPPEKMPDPQDPQLVDEEPVQWDEETREYRTHLPPPAGETPDQEWGEYGEPDYERTLTESEQALIDRLDALDTAERRKADDAERDAWVARVEAAIGEAEAAADASLPVRPACPEPAEGELVEGRPAADDAGIGGLGATCEDCASAACSDPHERFY